MGFGLLQSGCSSCVDLAGLLVWGFLMFVECGVLLWVVGWCIGLILPCGFGLVGVNGAVNFLI